MTHRERFLATMRYQATDRVPYWEFGAWPETIERWKKEGYDPDHPPFVTDGKERKRCSRCNRSIGLR